MHNDHTDGHHGHHHGHHGITCRENFDHVANCPICTKLYRQKRTGFIIAIVVLAILNLILLNRILSR